MSDTCPNIYLLNKLIHLNYFRASRDILYARQAPSSEKKYYNLANEILNFDIKSISFHGPDLELKKTKYIVCFKTETNLYLGIYVFLLFIFV